MIQRGDMKEIKLQATDISCDHCAMTIKRELASLAGAEVVNVDVAAKTITLNYVDEAVLAKAKELLDELGYPVAAV